jgi:aminopeptidase N
LGEAGYIGFDDYLRLAARLTPASDPVVLSQFVHAVEDLNHLYSGLATQAAFQKYARDRLSVLMTSVGWTPRAGEAANTGILRAALIEALAAVGDETTLAEAKRRFHARATDRTAISVGTRRAIVNALGIGADAALFDEMVALAVASQDTTEKRTYFLALAGAADPAIAQRLLALSITDRVPSQLGPNLIRAVAQVHPQLAFDFVTSHFDAVAEHLDLSTRVYFLPGVVEDGYERALAEQLVHFAHEKPNAAGPEMLARSRSIILFNAEVREQRLPKLDAWLSHAQ